VKNYSKKNLFAVFSFALDFYLITFDEDHAVLADRRPDEIYYRGFYVDEALAFLSFLAFMTTLFKQYIIGYLGL
jgi:hypothetical protein